MYKTQIQKRKQAAAIGLAAAVMSLTACTKKPELTAESFNLELGNPVSTNVADYLTFADPKQEADTTLDVSSVDSNTEGDYEATATYKNKTYTFQIHVEDTTPPAATLKNEVAEVPVGTEVNAADFLENIEDAQAVSVQFVNGEELTDTYTFETEGETSATIRLTDASGNSFDLAQNVSAYIPDTTAPVISGAKNHTVYIGGSVDYLKGVTVTDDTDGDITDKIAVNSDAVNTAKAGTYSVTYTVSDNAGNEATETVKITVKKKEAVQPAAAQAAPQQTESSSSSESHSSGSSSSSHSSGSSSDSGSSDSSSSSGTPETSQPSAPASSDSSSASESSGSSNSSDSGSSSGGTPVGVLTENGTLLGGLPKE